MLNIIEICKEIGIELTEEQQTAITKKVSENYKTVNEHTKKVEKLESERDGYKEQYETAKSTLDGFEGKDFDSITKDRDTWKSKAEQAEQDFNKRIESQEKEKAIDSYMETLHFASEFAKRAYKEDLIKAELPVREGKVFGANDFTESYDKSAFVDEATIEAEKKRSSIVGRSISGGDMSKMSIAELMKIKNQNPEVDITPYLKRERK